MAHQIASPVVDTAGKTRLKASLERARRGDGPSIGQWLEFPGYSLARTVAPLGEDVRAGDATPSLRLNCGTQSP
jgi:4-hydroxy-2-oxoheptanedioate aldolase